MLFRALLCCLLAAVTGAAAAQQAPVNSPLLDHLVGNWVLKGTTLDRPSTHDVAARWVLGHHYLEIHETSREKTASGTPQYEATVFLAHNDHPDEYTCAWLDLYGGLSAASIGHATPDSSHLRFVFRDAGGDIDFVNDFVYHAEGDFWEWKLDNVDHDVVKPFARYRLTRPASAS